MIRGVAQRVVSRLGDVANITNCSCDIDLVSSYPYHVIIYFLSNSSSNSARQPQSRLLLLSAEDGEAQCATSYNSYSSAADVSRLPHKAAANTMKVVCFLTITWWSLCHIRLCFMTAWSRVWS